MAENPIAKIEKQRHAMTRASSILQQIETLTTEIQVRSRRIDQLKDQLKEVQREMK